MVNTLSHFGIGLLIASLAGLEGRRKKIILLLAILPDFDFITSLLFKLIDGSLDHQMHNSLFYLLEHREFMHSFLFIFLAILTIHYYEKNLKFTSIAAISIFSHFYLDYATSWKMRPFFPFNNISSIMGSISFFDPIVTAISFIPICFVLLNKYREGKKDKENEKAEPNTRLKKIKKYSIQNRAGIYRSLAIVLVLWCILTPLSKSLLVEHISETEGNVISYQNSYPISTGKFVSAYSYNQTHYKIMEFTYLSGIKRYMFIPKISTGQDEDFQHYRESSEKLYRSSLPREIDYPVYNVSGNAKFITVSLTDARTPYTPYWAYFKSNYVFIFNRDNDDYTAYVKRQTEEEMRLPNNYFG